MIMKRNKFLSFILALIIAITTVPFGVMSASTNTIRIPDDVIFISTAEEFIDMQSGKSYALSNDIDFKNAELKPFFLESVTLYGNGCRIKNLSLNVTQSDFPTKENGKMFMGLFGYTDYYFYDDYRKSTVNYVYDLKIDNFTFNVSELYECDMDCVVTPLGYCVADNCNITGNFNMECDTSDTVFACGLWLATGSSLFMPITVQNISNGSGISEIAALYRCQSSSYDGTVKASNCGGVYGSYWGYNCVINADINSSFSNSDYTHSYTYSYDNHIFGLYEGLDEKFSGNINLDIMQTNADINSDFLAEACYSDYSEFNGDMNIYISDTNKIDLSVCAISSEGSSYIGNINFTSINTNEESTYSICGIGNYGTDDVGTDCVFKGNIEGVCDGGTVTSVISDGINCVSYGDINFKATGSCDVTAIGISGKNSSLYGDINCIHSNPFVSPANCSAIGVSGENAHYEGNVFSSYGAFGLENAISSYMEGDVRGNRATGIAGSKESKLKGNVNSFGSEYTKGYVTHIMGGSAKGIYDYSETGRNYMIGDVTSIVDEGWSYAGGISGGKGSTLIGNVILDNKESGGSVLGISGTDVYMQGNVTAKTESYDDHIFATGVERNTTGTLLGNLYAKTNCSERTGINPEIYTYAHSYGNHKGSITASCGLGTISYNPGNEYKSLYIYENCGHIGDTGYCEECADERDYYGVNWNYDVCQIDYTPLSGEQSSTGSDTIPSEPEMPADEEEKDYILKVIDEVTGEPYKNVSVNADGLTCVTDDNGEVSVKQKRVIKKLTVTDGDTTIHSEENYVLRRNNVNIIPVCGFSMDKEDISLLPAFSTQITGPLADLNGTSFPIFSLPYNINMTLDNLEFVYDSSSKTYKVIFGNIEEMNYNEISDEFIEAYNLLKDYYEKAKVNNLDVKSFFRDFAPKKGSIGAEGDYSLGGYLELKEKDGKLSIVSSGMVVALEGSVSGSVPLPPAPYIYLTATLGGEVESGIGIEIENATFSNPEFNIFGDLNLNFDVSGGAGAGVKGSVNAEAGVQGELDASATLPSESLETSFEAYFSGKFYILLNCLGFELKKSFTFYEKQLYPAESPVSLLSLSDAESFSLVEPKETGTSDEVYPYSEIKTAALSDGTVLAVYLDEDNERDSINKTALHYFTIKDGVKSDVVILHDDKTADFSFDLAGNGSKAAIVWQNSAKEYSNNDGIETVAKGVDIFYSEFSNGTWSEPINLTENTDVYEYNPALAYDGEMAHVIWTQNANNDIMPAPEAKSESIYKSTVTSSGAGDATLQARGLSLVADSSVSNSGTVAYIESLNRDAINCNVYVGTKKAAENVSAKELAYNSTGDYFYYNDGEHIVKIDCLGNVYETFTHNNIENIKILNVSEFEYVFGTQKSGSTTNISLGVLESEEKEVVTEPIAFCDGNISSYCVEPFGYSFCLGTIVSNVSYDDDEIKNTAVMNFENDFTSSLYSQGVDLISVTDAYTRDDVIPGSVVNLRVVLDTPVNLTESYYHTVDASITDENGNILATGTFPVYDYIAEIPCRLPADFEKQKITITVNMNESFIPDSVMENNSITIELGEANLKADIKCTENGTVIVYVKNNGASSVNGYITVVNENGELLFDETADNIYTGKTVTYSFDCSGHAENDTIITAQVTADDNEANLADNIATCNFKVKEKVNISFAEDFMNMYVGTKFTPTISAPDTSMKCVSSNEAVATVSDNGEITAVSNGETIITYLFPDYNYSESIYIYVTDRGNIYRDDFIDWYAKDKDGKLFVEFTEDLSQFVYATEKYKVIVAVYDENNRLIKSTFINTDELENGILYYCDEFDEKSIYIKTMIWDSLSSLVPIANVAESGEITLYNN